MEEKKKEIGRDREVGILLAFVTKESGMIELMKCWKKLSRALCLNHLEKERLYECKKLSLIKRAIMDDGNSS